MQIVYPLLIILIKQAPSSINTTDDNTKASQDAQYWNQIDYILCSQRWRSSIQLAKTRSGADCGSDHELLIAKDNLKLKKVGKMTRPFGESESRSVVSDSLWPHVLYSPWNSPGQNTGVGSLSHSVVFLYFFALITEEGFLISLCYSLELCIQMVISFLCCFAFYFSFFHSYL